MAFCFDEPIHFTFRIMRPAFGFRGADPHEEQDSSPQSGIRFEGRRQNF
jgi:hypothetical protein